LLGDSEQVAELVNALQQTLPGKGLDREADPSAAREGQRLCLEIYGYLGFRMFCAEPE
jgi:hypothetical protein